MYNEPAEATAITLPCLGRPGRVQLESKTLAFTISARRYVKKCENARTLMSGCSGKTLACLTLDLKKIYTREEELILSS